MRLFGALILGAILSRGPALASPDVPAPPLPRLEHQVRTDAPIRIVAFGSSSTQGVGASSAAASYPARLQAALTLRLPVPVEVVNRGIGGQDADDMQARVPAIVSERPDLVIWQTGSNDPLRGVPLDRFVQETREGIAAFRAAGIDVMLMEPQLCARLTGAPGSDRYRLALRQIGADMGVPVIRRYDLMRGWLDRKLITQAALMSGDGLHMADAGYAMLAEEVAQEIVSGVGLQRAAAVHASLH